MSEPTTTIDYAHFEWAIQQRAEIQKTMLALLKCCEKHKLPARSEMYPGDDVVKPIQLLDDLVAVAFSLWRAAFLAEDQLDYDAVHRSQQYLLRKLVTDNSFSFGDDRTSRYWMVNFYLENAQDRMRNACRKYTNLYRKRLPKYFESHYLGNGYLMLVEHTRYNWESIHFALRYIILKAYPEFGLVPIEPPDGDEIYGIKPKLDL